MSVQIGDQNGMSLTPPDPDAVFRLKRLSGDDFVVAADPVRESSRALWEQKLQKELQAEMRARYLLKPSKKKQSISESKSTSAESKSTGAESKSTAAESKATATTGGDETAVVNSKSSTDSDTAQSSTTNAGDLSAKKTASENTPADKEGCTKVASAVQDALFSSDFKTEVENVIVLGSPIVFDSPGDELVLDDVEDSQKIELQQHLRSPIPRHSPIAKQDEIQKPTNMRILRQAAYDVMCTEMKRNPPPFASMILLTSTGIPPKEYEDGDWCDEDDIFAGNIAVALEDLWVPEFDVDYILQPYATLAKSLAGPPVPLPQERHIQSDFRQLYLTPNQRDDLEKPLSDFETQFLAQQMTNSRFRDCTSTQNCGLRYRLHCHAHKPILTEAPTGDTRLRQACRSQKPLYWSEREWKLVRFYFRNDLLAGKKFEPLPPMIFQVICGFLGGSCSVELMTGTRIAEYDSVNLFCDSLLFLVEILCEHPSLLQACFSPHNVTDRLLSRTAQPHRNRHLEDAGLLENEGLLAAQNLAKDCFNSIVLQPIPGLVASPLEELADHRLPMAYLWAGTVMRLNNHSAHLTPIDRERSRLIRWVRLLLMKVLPVLKKAAVGVSTGADSSSSTDSASSDGKKMAIITLQHYRNSLAADHELPESEKRGLKFTERVKLKFRMGIRKCFLAWRRVTPGFQNTKKFVDLKFHPANGAYELNVALVADRLYWRPLHAWWEENMEGVLPKEKEKETPEGSWLMW
jgi:hypothetical protein